MNSTGDDLLDKAQRRQLDDGLSRGTRGSSTIQQLHDLQSSSGSSEDRKADALEDIAETLEQLLDDEDTEREAETPMHPFDLICLNPSGKVAPKNPLCPVCESQIVAYGNDYERRFGCDCEQTWRFEFRQEGDR